MKELDELDPSVRSLQRTIGAMREDRVEYNTDLEKKLDQLIGMMPRFPDHFIYVYNYSVGRIVYHRGFDEVLGYSDKEVDIDLLLRLFHPDDAPIIARINESTIKAMSRIRNSTDLFSLTLTVDYRMLKKNGKYIKVLRQTAVLEIDQTSGKVISTFSLCKDISAIKTSTTIGWQIRGPEMATVDLDGLQDYLSRLHYHPSPREKEILSRLCEGKASKEVATAMGISVFTVNTHRRNLLKRTGLRNTAQLIKRAILEDWV